MTYRIERELPDYDPALSNNGGSYCQPTYKVLFSDGTYIVLSDDSCGDFGTDINVRVSFPDGTMQECHYGSMLCDGQEYSTISQRGLFYFEQVEELRYTYHPLLGDINF